MHEGENIMLTIWNPLANGRRSEAPGASLSPDFDNLFQNFASFGRGDLPSQFAPPADVIETEDAIQIKMDIPGHSAQDIQVHLEGDTLTIRSERKVEKQVAGKSLRTERWAGVYSRSFVLPETVDGSKPEAKYADGVLTVTLPKREEAKPRLIKVEVKS
jgi:HSP20 family protein